MGFSPRGTSAAEAANENKFLIAALEALRHPNSAQPGEGFESAILISPLAS